MDFGNIICTSIKLMWQNFINFIVGGHSLRTSHCNIGTGSNDTGKNFSLSYGMTGSLGITTMPSMRLGILQTIERRQKVRLQKAVCETTSCCSPSTRPASTEASASCDFCSLSREISIVFKTQ